MTGRLVLVRHGQSHGNVDRRLDTRPPGAALTELGHQQARDVRRELAAPDRDGGPLPWRCARPRPRPTSASSSALAPHRLEGIHEVQVGELENRNDDDAIEQFNAIYQRWHEGHLDEPLPGGETRPAGARPLPARW